MFGAAPHSSDAAAKQTVPITNTRRRPNRSPSAPPNRISDASASRYPVRTHCNELTLAWKSSPMCGSATLTTVASSIAIPLAATVATSATRPFAECRTKLSAIAPVVALVTAARLLLSPAASVHHGVREGTGDR